MSLPRSVLVGSLAVLYQHTRESVPGHRAVMRALAALGIAPARVLEAAELRDTAPDAQAVQGALRAVCEALRAEGWREAVARLEEAVGTC